jgi:predicted deacylase
MIEVHSKALNKTIAIDRVLGTYGGTHPGPTLIFTGGIHGNEPSGVFALQYTLEWLEEVNPVFKGKIIAINGNLGALAKGIRYNHADLNRLWTRDKLAEFEHEDVYQLNDEVKQQQEIYGLLTDILNKEDGPFYFFDLHTTSGDTAPFITVNDSLLNRRFTEQYPVPIILGIEEFLEGPLLSYINELGYVAFGFEGGQHDSIKAYNNHIAFIFLSLVYTGCVTASQANYTEHFQTLQQEMAFPRKFFEIIYRQGIQTDDNFIICDGYMNFQKVKKGTVLAINNGNQLSTPHAGRIFMPLYQGKGNDGFFIIKEIPPVFLKLSAFLRNIALDRILVWLPGVRWKSKKREELVVNLKIARFFTRNFFHLLGYRSRRTDATHLRLRNRETASRTKAYAKAPWF